MKRNVNEKHPRILYKDGYRYIRLKHSEDVQREREQRGYARGYTDGERYAVWKPPTSFATALPDINYAVFPRNLDHDAYRRGFSVAYYQQLSASKSS